MVGTAEELAVAAEQAAEQAVAVEMEQRQSVAVGMEQLLAAAVVPQVAVVGTELVVVEHTVAAEQVAVHTDDQPSMPLCY